MSEATNTIKCADCGGVVSKRLNACPHCGAPTAAKSGEVPPADESNYVSTPVTLLVIGGALLMVVAIFLDAGESGTPISGPAQLPQERRLSSGGTDRPLGRPMNEIDVQVARDAVEQYDIVKRQGDAIEICVQAGFAAAAYLQAKDEANYRRWKQIENADCRAAGLTR
ncbi:MAG: hypothetical protein ACPHN2_04705 [Sinimarinibacterium flocculans]|uniref:hypothetical protein n=1 Tax=Sinimarinibacterium flocculans TaxID=985250 RepID=UPI003C46F2E6